MAKRCKGTTRAGKQCSITSTSQFTNDRGRLVAGPLQRGGCYCSFHAQTFVTRPVQIDRQLCVVLLDLESTGPDIAFDRIVEFAAIHCPSDKRFLGGSFGMMVHVDADVLTQFGECASSVHGISVEEIAKPGPDFRVVWHMFTAWLEGLQNTTVVEDGTDSDDECPRPTRLYPEPQLLLAGHNARKANSFVSRPGHCRILSLQI